MCKKIYVSVVEGLYKCFTESSEDSEMCGVVVVLARDLSSCQALVTKLKNLRNLKNLRISKTTKTEISVFPRVFEVFEFFEILNFKIFEISETFEKLKLSYYYNLWL